MHDLCRQWGSSGFFDLNICFFQFPVFSCLVSFSLLCLVILYSVFHVGLVEIFVIPIVIILIVHIILAICVANSNGV